MTLVKCLQAFLFFFSTHFVMSCIQGVGTKTVLLVLKHEFSMEGMICAGFLNIGNSVILPHHSSYNIAFISSINFSLFFLLHLFLSRTCHPLLDIQKNFSIHLNIIHLGQVFQSSFLYIFFLEILFAPRKSCAIHQNGVFETQN